MQNPASTMTQTPVPAPRARMAAPLRFAAGLAYLPFSVLQLGYLFVLPKKKFLGYFQGMEKREEIARVAEIRPFLEPGWKVLDVGSGAGRFGARLQAECGVSVTGVDVVDYNESTIAFSLYDGETLPFPDKSFDATITAFVLHHCKNQDRILSEMQRVSRKRILVLEDTYDQGWEWPFVAWNDYAANILQGVVKVARGYAKSGILGMPMPFKFRSIARWREIFAERGLRLVGQKHRVLNYKPLTKSLFVCDVEG